MNFDLQFFLLFDFSSGFFSSIFPLPVFIDPREELFTFETLML